MARDSHCRVPEPGVIFFRVLIRTLFTFYCTRGSRPALISRNVGRYSGKHEWWVPDWIGSVLKALFESIKGELMVLLDQQFRALNKKGAEFSKEECAAYNWRKRRIRTLQMHLERLTGSTVKGQNQEG